MDKQQELIEVNYLHFIKRQFAKWYSDIHVMVAQIFNAIITYCNTIIGVPFPALAYGYYGNVVTMGFTVNQSIPTFGASGSQSIVRILPIIGTKSHPAIIDNIHKRPSLIKWKKSGNYYYGYQDNKAIGLYISPKDCLYINSPTHVKRGIVYIHPPAYGIKYSPLGHDYTLHIADMPTLRQAKQLAEDYYYVFTEVRPVIDG